MICLPDGLMNCLDCLTEAIFLSLMTLQSVIQENRNDSYLSALNESLKEKLQSWLVGFLDLERLTWQSPAVLLEKVT